MSPAWQLRKKGRASKNKYLLCHSYDLSSSIVRLPNVMHFQSLLKIEKPKNIDSDVRKCHHYPSITNQRKNTIEK